MARYVIDPSTVDDYGRDFTPWLEQDETITSQTATPEDGGLTVTNVSQNAGIVSYRVSGGTLNTDQRVVIHVTSSTGRQNDATDTFLIRDK